MEMMSSVVMVNRQRKTAQKRKIAFEIPPNLSSAYANNFIRTNLSIMFVKSAHGQARSTYSISLEYVIIKQYSIVCFLKNIAGLFIFCRKQKKEPQKMRFFLVRETGLEPVRIIHTPLKRARLPVPPLSHWGFL